MYVMMTIFKIMKKLLFLLILSCIGYSSYAQKHYTQNYNINNGLPGNYIRDLYKDSQSFLWIGTQSGLTRFDGSNFKNYSSQTGLLGNNIQSICEGKNGDIWVAISNQGINRINGDRIESYTHNSGLVSNLVTKIFFSENIETLFIGTQDGLTIYNEYIGFKSFHPKFKNVTKSLTITSFAEINEEVYIFTAESGVFKFQQSSEYIVEVSEVHEFFYEKTNLVFADSNCFLASFNQISLEILNKKSKKQFKKFGLISDFVKDSNDNIWIAAWQNNYWNKGGLYKYTGDSLIKFNSFLDIESDNITALEYDEIENILWIGTQDQGLYLFPINHFVFYDNDLLNLNKINVNNFIEHDSKIYISTSKGVVIISEQGNKIIPIDLFKKRFKHFAKKNIKSKYQYLVDKKGSYNKYQSLIKKNLYSYSNPYSQLAHDNKKACNEGCLCNPSYYDLLTNKQFAKLAEVFTDKKGNVWVGSNVGIFKIIGNDIKYYDLEGNHFSSFIFDNKNKLLASNCNSLFKYQQIEYDNVHLKFNSAQGNIPINASKIRQNKGGIWFLSPNGVYVLDDDEFHKITSQLPDVFFTDICFDNDNVILGGTNGNIYIGKYTKGKFALEHTISSEYGLIGTTISWLECHDKKLIIGTNKGINIISLEKLYQTNLVRIKTYNRHDGFFDYNGKTSFIDDKGYLWIGSNNILKVDLNLAEAKQTVTPQFLIKKIEVNDEEFDLSTIERQNIWTNIPETPINLLYNQNSITFYFDVIRFFNPQELSFSYKLEGTNKAWSEPTRDKKIVFQNLNPGKYKLRIKAFCNNENSFEEELVVDLNISFPLWQRWYAIVSIGILVAFVVWLIVFVRTRAIRKRERVRRKLAEKISEFEMKALRAQMNPHFIFNAINSIQNFMLDNDIDKALNYLSDFAKLIRLTLDNVSKKLIPLEDELEYLKYYLNLERMRFNKSFELEISISDDYNFYKVLIPPMLIQPFVENAIKHGFICKKPDARITLRFEIIEEIFLRCTVEDNGIGREKSKSLNKNNKMHKSYGTFITNERLNLLNETQNKNGYKIQIIDLYDDDENPAGTRVEIFIPV